MRVAGVAAAVLAALACSPPPGELAPDDGRGGGRCPAAAPVHPAELLADMPEVDTEGCVPGSLLDVDIDAVWRMEGDFTGTVRFTNACGGLQTGVGEFAELTDEGLYWGSALPSYQRGTAYRVCRVDADGSLWGHAAYTSRGQEFRGEIRLVPLGWNEEAESEGLEELSRWSGPPDDPWNQFRTMNVRVDGDVAYLITREALRLIDVSDPRAPADLGFFPSRHDAFNDVKLLSRNDRRYAVLGSNNLGAVVVDVTDPGRPVEVRRFGAVPGRRAVHTLFIDERAGRPIGYFLDGSSPVLGVFDLSDPTSPAALTQYDGWFDDQRFRYGFHDLYVEGDRAYINATDEGFVVLDVGDLGAVPRVVGTNSALGYPYSHSNWVTTVNGRKIAVHGGEFAGSIVSIVDVEESSPSFMQTIGEFRMREEISVHNIMAIGNRAYVAYYQNGLRVLDLSDPTSPQQIAYFNTWDPVIARGEYFEGALGVDVDSERGLIYVADSESGLVILRERR